MNIKMIVLLLICNYLVGYGIVYLAILESEISQQRKGTKLTIKLGVYLGFVGIVLGLIIDAVSVIIRYVSTTEDERRYKQL